jgi:hypothetical protein
LQLLQRNLAYCVKDCSPYGSRASSLLLLSGGLKVPSDITMPMCGKGCDYVLLLVCFVRYVWCRFCLLVLTSFDPVSGLVNTQRDFQFASKYYISNGYVLEDVAAAVHDASLRWRPGCWLGCLQGATMRGGALPEWQA